MRNLYQGDCLEVMKEIPNKSIDLTVTSPPYDNLRTYKGNNDQWGPHVWKGVLESLYRVTKDGGVVVWIVNDATIKGSETGTSFRQALHAIDCGFRLHDTMVWHKTTNLPSKSNRYQPSFEYMFIFSRGAPLAWAPIKVQSKTAGRVRGEGLAGGHSGRNGWVSSGKAHTTNAYKTRDNVWDISSVNSSAKKYPHPAKFPLKLVTDHIRSWSNQFDTVFDPFMGSGTTGVAARNLARYFIGIELDAGYYEIAKDRIQNG